MNKSVSLNLMNLVGVKSDNTVKKCQDKSFKEILDNKNVSNDTDEFKREKIKYHDDKYSKDSNDDRFKDNSSNDKISKDDKSSHKITTKDVKDDKNVDDETENVASNSEKPDEISQQLIASLLNSDNPKVVDFLKKILGESGLENLKLNGIDLKQLNLNNLTDDQRQKIGDALKNINLKELDLKEVADLLPKDFAQKLESLLNNEKSVVDESANVEKSSNLVESVEVMPKNTNKENLIDENVNDDSSEDAQMSNDLNIAPKNDASNKNDQSAFANNNQDDSDLESLKIKLSSSDDKKEGEIFNLNSISLKVSGKSKLAGISGQRIIQDIDILNQIISKTKSLDKDNSFMQISLNPEDLGKITLKVAMEKGMLTANFTTENEKVKSAIENNMQELKKNLEEQGINIQSINVSVDSNEQFDRHKGMIEAMNYNKKVANNISDSSGEAQDDISSIDLLSDSNPYFVEDNFNQLA